jgi:hypothetical protein
MDNWIKVEDKLPEGGMRVLAYGAGTPDDFVWDIGFRLIPVTPWMPRPETAVGPTLTTTSNTDNR